MIQVMATGVASLAVLLFMCGQCSPADGLFFPSSGETQPPSSFTEVYHLKEGEKLEITCTLLNTTWRQSCNASNMSLRLSKNPLDTEYLIVGTQTPIGPYTIRLLVEKASANESGTYYCYCHNTAISFTKVMFSIAAPPEKPVIVKIIAENMENLTVIVDPVRNDSSLNNSTTWSLRLNSRDKATSVVCSEVVEPFRCDVHGLSNFALAPTDVTIFAINNLGNSSTDLPGELLWHYVRPLPVTADMQILSSSRVMLTWSKPAGLETFRLGGLIYHVTLLPQSVFSPVQLNFTCAAENETSERDCLSMARELEVHPFTRYNLSLRSHPVVGGHWSAPTVLSFATDEDVPRKGPEILPWRYTAVQLSNGTDRAVIYPKELWEGDRAGVITRYELEYPGQGWTQRVEGTPASVELLPPALPPDSELTVRLWACTAKGRSIAASSLTLPPRNSAVAGPSWLDVERVNSSHRRLLWERQDLQPNSQVQLHWCWGSVDAQAQAPMVFCRTDISSRVVESGSTSAWFEDVNVDPCGGVTSCSLHFGLSVENGGTSSGIIWNTCIFNSNEVAAQVTNIQVSGSAESLEVYWMYPCHLKADRFQARPLKFESRISLSHNTSQSAASDCNWSQDTKETAAIHGENSHPWTGLEAEKPYLFCVRSLSDNGHPGSWAVKVQSISAGPSHTVAIAVGVSVAVLVAVLGLILGLALCHKLRSGKLPITSLKANKQPDIPGTVPAMYDYIPPLKPTSKSPAQLTEVSELQPPVDIAVTDKVVTDKVQNGHCPMESGIETGSMSSEIDRHPSVEEGVEQAWEADGADGYGLVHGVGLAMGDSDSRDDGHLISNSSAPDGDAVQGNVNPAFDQDEDSETRLQAATHPSTAVTLLRDNGRARADSETTYDPGSVRVSLEEEQESSNSSPSSHGSSSSISSSNNMHGLPKGYVRQSNPDGKIQAEVRQTTLFADKPDLPAPTNAGGDVQNKQLQLQAVKSKAENQTDSGDTMMESCL